MASILRSSKFVRYIVGFTRNVVLNTPRECDGNFVNATSPQCLCGAIPRSLATQASFQPDHSLEKRLKTLDQDVRRSGRISRRDIEDVLEEIRNTRSATSSQSLLVIRCCGNLVPEELPEVRTKLVQEIWNTLNKLNIPMDISHYNALLRVYLENEHKFSPTDFLAELEAKGIEPNRVTYQRLIARYCQDGDIEGATRILEFMREKQMAVNENVFNALIVGHSKTGDMDSAEGILSVMTQAGLEPSADTYTTLLCGYAQKGDIENIQKTLNECETKEIFLLDKDYFDVIYSLARNGYSEHIPFILSKVRKAIGYNQDAINLILRLINKGQEDAAFIILKSMPRSVGEDGTPRPTGAFFLRQLVKANRPIEKILQYCDLFEKENLYPNSLQFVTQVSLETANENVAYQLLQTLQGQGIPIRQHYFWPLIVSKANTDSEDGIINILLKMQEFRVTANTETIRDYVLPNLKGDSAEIISKLTRANVSVGAAACSLAHKLLIEGKIAQAAEIMSRINAYYYPELLKRPLTHAFYNTSDLDSYIRIIRRVHDNVSRREFVEQDDKTIDAAEVVGSLVLDLAVSETKFGEVIEAVLSELVNEGLSITASSAEKIQDKLGDKMTEDISNLLSKLSSGELTPVQLKRTPSYVPANQMNIPQLERLIQNLKAKGQEQVGLQRQLLTLYCRARDLPKTEQLLQELGDKLQFTNGVLAQLCELYAANDQLEKSLEYYEKLKAQEGDSFVLDASKIIRIVNAFVVNGKFDEGFDFLQNATLKNHRDQSFLFRTLVWRLFNTLAEQGRVEELRKYFDYLLDRTIIEPANTLLGPLVKVHIVRDEIDKALEVFADCCTRYRATPFKYELACRLIQNEDAENLQKITDLSTTVHGEINSLYDLVFAFIECGRIRQARKILETPGMQGRPQKINFACERYRQEGMVKQLEGLKEATKDLSHIDRSDIYYQLLMSYIKQEDVDKALGLWTQLQEEDALPTDQFLFTLGNFLKERNVSVPFVIPKPTPKAVQETPVTTSKTPKKLNVYRERINSGDLDWVMSTHRVQPESFSESDRSFFIEKLVQNDRLNEAKEVALYALNKNNRPAYRIFRFLLNKLALAGDVDGLENIAAKLDDQDKKLLSFDNRLCNANVVAGRAEEYLNRLENEITNVKDDEVDALYQQFPRGGAYGILDRCPEFAEKFTTIAEKYASRGCAGPMNVLWTYHFINGNDAVAEKIWNEYVKDSPRIMFQRILQQARDSNDEQLSQKLISHLKSSKVTEGALGNAYSCLLDILTTKAANERVVEEFEKAVKDVNINFINKTAVLRVQAAYEQLGKPFNYKVPTKADKQSSTSSSSSDVEKKA